ncbi:MAG: 2-C-methyl-D-erythritol 2,4-cyclodiphosphate synthase [Clostridia bacterium]|nr:2-C-methyl-D-erythritol 2,4-cyclodiphosphate synthase [Clostridia bacterium]
MRIGIGSDTHRFAPNRDFILGGVKIEHTMGLLGHSDADALAHAIIDALLGAAAMGDIGRLYPDTEYKYKNISSMSLLEDTGHIITNAGYEIINIDSIIILQAPRLAPYVDNMITNVAETLGLTRSQVSVKAKTNETMGFIGRGEGIEVRAIALIE